MDRRNFVKNTGFIGGGIVLTGSQVFAGIANEQYAVPLNQAMRWAQLAFVESDPGNYDPDFWLNYFKRIHAQGVLLSAGGVVAFYPTNIPFHYRSRWMKNTDPLGYLVNGCRRMNMAVILRTDPHATRQDTYEAHPDWIHVTADGKKKEALG